MNPRALCAHPKPLAAYIYTDSDGKVSTVTFTGSRIGGITYNDSTSVSFTYDTGGKLLSVTDVDGSRVKFTYSSHGSKGVKTVQEYGTGDALGQKITFDRTKYNTTVIQTSGTDGVFNNTNDIITTCQFDNFGKLTSTYSKSNDGTYLSASDATYTSGTLNSDASNIKTVNKVSQAYTVGANTENLLKNHNMESTSNWTSAKWGSGTVAFSASANSTASNVLYGQSSVGMTVTSVTNDARGRIYQSIDEVYLKPGASYTLSCYVKVTDIAPIAEDDTYGAVIGLTTFFDDGTSKNYYSEHISKVTDTSVNNGFRRLSVTVSIPTADNFDYIKANLAIHSATGTAYFDGVQLEKAYTAGHYNMLQNASFERASLENWAGTNTDSTDGRSTTEKLDGSASVCINGEVSTSKNFHQDVAVSGSKADTYILSGWALGNAVPNETNSSYFELRVRIYYSNDTTLEKRSAPFNTTLSDWQYASFAFNLDNNKDDDATPTKIRVYVINFRQGNSLYFDNLMLTKEAVPSYTYDDEGNLISVVANAEQNSSYEYADNQLTSMVDPAGYGYEYEYDSNKRLTSATTSTGLKYTYTYDGYGNANSVVANGGTDLNIKSEVFYSYPGKGAETYTVYANDQNNYTSSSIYNAKNGTLVSATDVNGNTTEYTYNTKNDLVTDIVSGNQSVSYDYSADYKNIESITHGDTTYSFTYDEYGNTVKTEVGNRILAANNYYDNNGNLKTVTYGNGDNMSYAYDAFGNVSLLVKDNQNVAKNYSNGRGDIIRSVDLVNNLETRLNYDTTGRLISKDVYNSSKVWLRSIEYDYDLNNNLTRLSFTDSSGAKSNTQYRYGADNLPLNMMLSNGETLMYKYDGLNRLTKKTLYTDTKIISDYTYTTSARGSSYTTSALETEETNAFGYKYTYYKDGNIKYIFKGLLNDSGDYVYGSTPTVEYKYDSYGQLTTVNDYSKNEQYSYSYNKDGNITGLKHYSMNSNGWFPVATLESYSYTYADSDGWGDLLTSYNGETITYDEIGNPLAYRDGITMTWVNGRELASLSKDGKTLNFTYDPDGLRTKKSITSSTGTTTNVEYVYEDGLLRQMTYGNYVLDFSYDANGTPVAFHVDNGGTVDKYYYYGVNSRGDVEALYNADGTLHAKYEYDAYGKLIAATQPDGTKITATYAIAVLNPLRYRSYVYDNETGLYYLQSRYYDPITCRFVNGDSQLNLDSINGFNQFAYCDNNPIISYDPNGKAHVMDYAGGFPAPSGYYYSGSGGAGGGVGMLAGALIGTAALAPMVSHQTDGMRAEKFLILAFVETTTKVIEETTPVYYGVDLRGGGGKFNYKTPPMDFVTACTWTATTTEYGKGTSWGLYTKDREDAYAIALFLGGGKPEHDYGENSGYYNHYHVKDRIYLGKYKHFHIWYGDPIP